MRHFVIWISEVLCVRLFANVRIAGLLKLTENKDTNIIFDIIDLKYLFIDVHRCKSGHKHKDHKLLLLSIQIINYQCEIPNCIAYYLT